MQDNFRSFSTVKEASSALHDTHNTKSGILNNISHITMWKER